MKGDFCDRCGMPYDTLIRDEARLAGMHVLLRCAECSHIVIYRSGGKPGPSEKEIQRATVSAWI